MYQDCPACWSNALVLGDGRRVAERPAAVESRWSTGELDSPFHLKAVFWHLVQTFVGIRRIVFALEDFHGEEREEVAMVLAAEGIQVPKTNTQGEEHVREGPTGASHTGGIRPGGMHHQQARPALPESKWPQARPALPESKWPPEPSPSVEQAEEQMELEAHEARSTSQLFLGLLALSAAAGSIICYFGQDAENVELDDVLDMEVADRDLGRETRAPIFRQPSVEDEAELQEVEQEVENLPMASDQIAEAAE